MLPKAIKIGKIGQGSYGKTFLCKTGKGKKIVSKEQSEKDTRYELQFYKKFNNRSTNIAKFEGYSIGKKISNIFLQKYDHDLRFMIRDGIDFCVTKFIINISKALQFLKENEIIYGDLKPENILYDRMEDNFVLCDFGLSLKSFDKKIYPIQSPYYRSPEVFCSMDYSYPIDIFSLGCIIYELETDDFFMHGREEYEMFISLIEKLGLPDKSVYSPIYKTYLTDGPNPQFLHPCLGKIPIDIEKFLFSELDYGDLIMRCLELSPEKRITPEEIISILS